jgi:broad specificity phosphatase PhoE
MQTVLFMTHPDVLIDPTVKVPDWPLNARGRERAVDAQTRILTAMRDVLRAAPSGDVAVISHGGVGALLLCHLQGSPISRAAGQPPGSGGYVLAFDRTDGKLRHGWRRIDG